MTFRTWEQLTVVEQLQSDYSQEWLEGAINDLLEYSKIVFAQQAEDEANAIVRFEQLVSDTIAMGARNRETALRWVMDGSDAGGDWEYLCFQYGLPYGYFKKAA